MVGAGYSGTLLAVQLLRQPRSDLRVCLIERASRAGPGRAYGTDNPRHLLNVQAGRMGAFPDRPTHFLDWLNAQPGGAPVMADDFVPRFRYGDYLRHLLDQAAADAPGRLDVVQGEVVALTDAPSMSIRLSDGRVLQADAAVLSTGNFTPLPPPGIDPAHLGRAYSGDPWGPDMAGGLAPDAAVLLVGTGLTMADTVVSLLDAGHQGDIHLLSRRGLLPRRHISGTAVPPLDKRHPDGLVSLLRSIRRQVADSDAPWQSVLDRLRPALVGLWLGASVTERRRFLRHLRPWWDVHRHRLPGATADCLDETRARGQLHLHAGRIMAADPDGQGNVEVSFLPRGARSPRWLTVARIVNCTGPAADYRRITDPLIRHLLDEGVVRPDPLKLGLDIADDYALRRADGAASPRLFVLGPVLRAAVWEMTSVPDLRNAVERLARQLATSVAAAG